MARARFWFKGERIYSIIVENSDVVIETDSGTSILLLFLSVIWFVLIYMPCPYLSQSSDLVLNYFSFLQSCDTFSSEKGFIGAVENVLSVFA